MSKLILATSAVFCLYHVAAAADSSLLNYAACTARGVPGCVDSVSDLFTDSGDLAISPDGQSVYVVGRHTHSITHLLRNTETGELKYAGCVGHGSAGCTDVGATTDAMRYPTAVTVSPDGSSIYVIGYPDIGGKGFAGVLVHFQRNRSTGALMYAGCIGNGARGCTSTPLGFNILSAPLGIAVSPDLNSVYVSGASSQSIAYFSRDPLTGALKFVSCVGQGAAGCTDISARTNALTYAAGLSVSPDGRNVYATGYFAGTAGAVATFRRVDGHLTYLSCIGQGALGCTPIGTGINMLKGTQMVAVSPDSESVYVTALDGSAVTHFDRDLDGALRFSDCIGQGTAGCRSVGSIPALGGAAGLALARNGDIYVSAYLQDAVTRLRTDSRGDLFFSSCAARGSGCATYVPTLRVPTSLVLSSDGRSLYVLSSSGPAGPGMILHFRGPDCSP